MSVRAIWNQAALNRRIDEAEKSFWNLHGRRIKERIPEWDGTERLILQCGHEIVRVYLDEEPHDSMLCWPCFQVWRDEQDKEDE